jgi:hypothetical protein
MRKGSYYAALLGVAMVSGGVSSTITVMLAPTKVLVVQVAAPPSHRSAPFPLTPRAVPKARLAKTVRPLVVPHVVPARATPVHTAPSVRPRTSPSLYERTTSPKVLREQGCRAGGVRTYGLVILDFGKPAYRRGLYGTITFANHFASNTAITWAMKSYARGYVECLPKGAKARITLVRGTSNYHLRTVPDTYEAGRRWAKETAVFSRYLHLHGFDAHVKAAAGNDVEPAWDRTFKRTFKFYDGFRSVGAGHLLYNYGSLDGGAGGIWTVHQAYYVTTGMRYARAVPEIYNHSMAKQWAKLSRLSVKHYGKPVHFAGVMTQHSKKCLHCGFTAAEAHTALVRELAKSPTTRVRTLAVVTNIGTPPRHRPQP